MTAAQLKLAKRILNEGQAIREVAQIFNVHYKALPTAQSLIPSTVVIADKYFHKKSAI
jgi:hypothetical protein